MKLNWLIYNVVLYADYWAQIVHIRSSYWKHSIRRLAGRSATLQLSKEQKEAVRKIWRRWHCYFDSRWFDYFNCRFPDSGTEICRFIPPDFFGSYIDPLLVSPHSMQYVDDKNWYGIFLKDVRQPETVLRYIHGSFVDSSYSFVSENRAREILSVSGRIVVKQAVNSCCGSNILFWDSDSNDIDSLCSFLKKDKSYVIQRQVDQHPLMASLNPSSCNTIRIVSYVGQDRCDIICGVIRFGGVGARLDNFHNGGYVVGVDKNGVMDRRAINISGGTKEVESFVVPGFGECVEIARTNAAKFINVARLVVWDYAIGVDGNPILIEINMGNTDTFILQACCGPVFSEYLDDWLDMVPHKLFVDRFLTDDIK